jgi:integrase/recombinase XerD
MAITPARYWYRRDTAKKPICQDQASKTRYDANFSSNGCAIKLGKRWIIRFIIYCQKNNLDKFDQLTINGIFAFSYW